VRRPSPDAEWKNTTVDMYNVVDIHGMSCSFSYMNDAVHSCNAMDPVRCCSAALRR
jgi:hypothetical protein